MTGAEFTASPVQHYIGSVMPTDPSENMAVSLALGGLAFVVTLILGRPIVTFLRMKKLGDVIRADGPQTHIKKMGTPTMGGAMVALTVIIITAVFNLAGRLSMLLPIGILLAAALLGAVDDRIKLGGVSNPHRRGMTARFKFAWLVIFAVVAGCILHFPDPWGLGLHHIYIPFFGRFNIGLLYLPIAIFAIVAMSNAVNLTDGLDTLAAGLAGIAFLAFGIIAYQQGQVGVVTFCFTMVGSLMGFLWFNAHPAQVFMGDTGSLAIGAALATAGRRLRVRRRGVLRHAAGALFQVDEAANRGGEASLQDDAAAPPFRDHRLVRDPGHDALLDRRHDGRADRHRSRAPLANLPSGRFGKVDLGARSCAHEARAIQSSNERR
jgi:phospho-N-acetylmuramoyl-pentapeptide-transferase